MIRNDGDWSQMDIFEPDAFLPRKWGRVSYTSYGAGKPVILIHGSGRSRHDWAPYHHWLRGRRQIAIDLRGHGGSDIPQKYFKFKRLADDVLALIDHLWIAPADIVGHSLGGMVALETLRQAPERVHKIALLDTWISMPRSRMLGEMYHGITPEKWREIEHQMNRSWVRWIPTVRTEFGMEMQDFDAEELLRTTKHEILALYGDRGAPRPQQSALGIPDRSNIEFGWIADGSHYFPQFQIDATGKALRTFLIGQDQPPEDPPPPSLQELMIRPR